MQLGDSVEIESTTEQCLETCFHSDTCLPIQLITNNSQILSLLHKYLHYTKTSNALLININLYAECNSANVYLLNLSMLLLQCCNKNANNFIVSVLNSRRHK